MIQSSNHFKWLDIKCKGKPYTCKGLRNEGLFVGVKDNALKKADWGGMYPLLESVIIDFLQPIHPQSLFIAYW